MKGKMLLAVALSVLMSGLFPANLSASTASEMKEALQNAPIAAQQDIDDELVDQIANAIAAGWEKIEADSTNDTLTEQEELAATTMLETIPGILNKIQKSTSEVETELNKACLDLANQIIAVQNEQKVVLDTQEKQEIAVALISAFVLPSILYSGAVEDRVLKVLMKEGMNALVDQMFAEQE